MLALTGWRFDQGEEAFECLCCLSRFKTETFALEHHSQEEQEAQNLQEFDPLNSHLSWCYFAKSFPSYRAKTKSAYQIFKVILGFIEDTGVIGLPNFQLR